MTEQAPEICDCTTESLGEYGEKIIFCPLHEAAPDLLAALEEIHKAQPPRKASGYDDYKRFYFFVKGRARPAIAKARGTEGA